MQTQFWLNDPSILFNQKYISNLWPSKDMHKEEKLNAITRVIIILTILLYLMTSNIRVIMAGFVTIIAIIVLKYAINTPPSSKNKNVTFKENKEGFSNIENKDRPLETPTVTNPLMNVTLPQIQYDPTRPPAAAAYKPDTLDKINTSTQDAAVSNFDNTDGIKEKLFADLGDSFMFDRSMVQFNATANTTIPNDQKSFAEFCYGDMISCKEGNALACTRSAPPNWING